MKLRALDLFCSAGGATRGLQLARWWQFGDPPYAGPRELLTALASAVSRPVAQSTPPA